MIILITAVPGSGKTLYALDYYKKLAEKENRQVYYSGIPLTDKGKEILKWTEIENPKEWHTLPSGSIVIIDESQRIFPVRKIGSTVPDYIEAFETKRHNGVDVVLITQHPSFIDAHIRKLVGKHTHLIRAFGAGVSTVFNWGSIQDNFNSQSVKKACADQFKFIYPKQVYEWYTSAEMHTHKLQLPRKLYWMIPAVILIIGSIIFTVYWLFSIGKDVNIEEDQVEQKQEKSVFNPLPVSIGDSEKKVLTPEQYVELRKPRILNIPESAPVYDGLAEVKTFPKISACIESEEKCQCYSQQGTKLFTSEIQCKQYVKEGWFDPYLEQKENKPLLAEREPVLIKKGNS